MEPPPPVSSFSNSTEGAVWLSVSGSTNRNREFPILISSPEASTFSVTGTPLTNVLLRLFRSCILNSSATRRMRQCRRETEASRIATRLAGSRPIETSRSVKRKLLPFSGPARASSSGVFSDILLWIKVYPMRTVCGERPNPLSKALALLSDRIGSFATQATMGSA